MAKKSKLIMQKFKMDKMGGFLPGRIALDSDVIAMGDNQRLGGCLQS